MVKACAEAQGDQGAIARRQTAYAAEELRIREPLDND